MAKLSTAAIRTRLINRILEQGDAYVDLVAHELDKELVRIYTTQFGYTPAQVEAALSTVRSYPVNIINQYFHMHDDKWLRSQHSIWFPSRR